jgi:hypothetical protein
MHYGRSQVGRQCNLLAICHAFFRNAVEVVEREIEFAELWDARQAHQIGSFTESISLKHQYFESSKHALNREAGPEEVLASW